ncbi:zinc finger Ran-binding domain-containing protein 2-like isoform X3 [Ornithodoros turicata]|uniref:zinc finger Ran-binding domain-containing protein 2-like isoform X3 n=1 Tax=Ornithodoros turicata TaxID=34597 RepID=UPI0031393A88
MHSEEERYYSGSEKHRSSKDGKKFRMNDGDWVCPDPQCANVNFARRTSCNRCGKDKIELPSKRKLGHEIGKAAAEKSRGLFSADDWQCGRCGNVNWARRSTCNMCNAPKFGEVEERTGLGGGYNERENVEYIEREESDGEYDDFGRRKKKQRRDSEDSGAESSSVAKQQQQHSKPDEEEDEEEDEDEDGDLSKYDLSGWGDDDDDGGDKAEKQGEPKSGETKSESRKSRSSDSSSSSSSRSSSVSHSSERRRRRSSSSSSSSSSRSRSRSRDRHHRDENSRDSSSRSSSGSSTRRRSRSRERFARGKNNAWGV